MDPFNPPIPVSVKRSGKSKRTPEGQLISKSGESALTFGTYHLAAKPLREKPTPSEELLWSMGRPDEVAPSQAIWGRGKWELTIGFTLHNSQQSSVSVHDIRAHVYYVSGVEMPLAMVIHRARIELTEDNSIFSDGLGFLLQPMEIEQIEFVLETSLYDTLMTTIVFGLFVDYQFTEGREVKTKRLPSDQIYIFQHRRDLDPGKSHFAGRNEASIRARAQEEPSNVVVQEFCESLQNIFQIHSFYDPSQTPPAAALDASVEPGKKNGAGNPMGADVDAPRDWPANYENLTQFEPASDLLKLCVFFGSDKIPSALINEAFYERSLSMYDALTSVKGMLSGDLYWRIHKLNDGTRHRDEAIDLLLRHGFLVRDVGGQWFSMPRGLGERVLGCLDQETQRHWVEYAIRSIDSLLPENPPSAWAEYEPLLPHAKACMAHASRLGIESVALAGMVHQFGEILVRCEMYKEAEPFCQCGVEFDERTFGATHLIVGVGLLFLAEARRKIGNTADAEPLLKRAEKILAQRVGKQHPDYAVCLHNLGALYVDEGRYPEAERLFQEALPLIENAFHSGPNYPKALEDYARLLQLTNRSLDAQRLLERASAIRNAGELGSEQPN